MKTVRQSNLAGLLTALALILGVIAPGSAQADEASGWPLHMVTGMTPTSMAAFGNDTLSFANCSNSGQANSFQYVYEGSTASTLPTSQVGSAPPPQEGVQCTANQGLMTADGTFYTTDIKENGSYIDTLSFVAMKNGRALWSSDLGSQNDPICGSMSSWGSEAHDEVMTYASQGSDGNIYGIVQQNNSGCATYLAGVSGVDGHVLFKQLLTNDGAFKSARAWVYGDKILTIDYTGKVRQFSYDGTENTSAAYQFPMSTIGTITGTYANANGRVFVTGTGNSSDTVIGYADLNGANGTINSGLGPNPGSHFIPGAGGTFVAVNTLSGAVTTYHIASTGITTTSVSGLAYSTDHAAVTNYWQDSNGNAVEVRQLLDSNWAPAGVTVDRIDGTTGVATNLLLVGVDSTHPSPSLKTADISPDGSVYAVICHDNSACGNTSGASLDGWIHKVQTTNFGSPIKDTGSFTTYVSTKLNYVAMGDSYSSGQYNSPYLPGTDVQNTPVDTCHRSAAAYPALLEDNTNLSLDMTAFVACAGAQENQITSPNTDNNEPAQISAVRSDTNLITISVGGNDAGFPTVMSTCTLTNALTGAQQDASMTQAQADEQDCTNAISAATSKLTASSFTDNLTALYNTIMAHASPNTKLVVVEYPQLFPEYANMSAGCEWGTIATDLILKTDGRAVSQSDVTSLRAGVTQINADIRAAITATNNSNITFADPTTTFAGHEECTSDPWFSGIVVSTNTVDQQGSYHPNAAGQEAYASVVAAKISTLTFP